jgi:hypothetical protein
MKAITRSPPCGGSAGIDMCGSFRLDVQPGV